MQEQLTVSNYETVAQKVYTAVETLINEATTAEELVVAKQKCEKMIAEWEKVAGLEKDKEAYKRDAAKRIGFERADDESI